MFVKKCYLVSLAIAFFVHCCMAQLAMSATATAKATNYTDQSALLAIKAHITFDPNNVLANNWTTATSFCNWIGVSCSRRRQRVTALNLPNMGLHGIIAPHVGNLSFLVLLNLGNNSFQGHLPDEVGNLSRLRVMILQDNKLDGIIPPSLSQCSELQEVSLTYNMFTGNIPRELGILPNLRELFLGGNKLQGTLSPLGNISTLQSLALEGNRLGGNIPKEIGNLLNLEELYLSENDLLGAIPSTILNISSLKIIDLTDNGLSGSLPEDIGYQLPGLELFYLSANQLSGQIPSSLCQCGELQDLSLAENKFIGSIPKEIGSLSKLQFLSLGVNHLTGNVPPSLGNISWLEELYLSQNYIQGEIPQELGNLLNLKILSFGMNNVTGPIPKGIFNISSLQDIELAINDLSGDVPATTGMWLPSLEVLNLARNQLSGKIPIFMSNASKLKQIDLSENLFNGSIPMNLGNLKQLQLLNLYGNQLVNQPVIHELTFLTSLTNCRFLETLSIGSNTLNGILPESVGNLSTSLQEFDVYNGQIRGDIPIGIGNLSNLITIRLDNNNLSGTIPSTIGRLQKLQRLYLNGNKIQGIIPSQLCQLRSVGELYLDENKLSGSIPNCIGNISRLQWFSLASNQLTSEIPMTLWSLQSVLSLNLSLNSLDGRLQPEVSGLESIEEMDLSWNQLSGVLPTIIGNLRSLRILGLSQNSFQGPIPQSLGNLMSLEILDLSSNALSGVIPKSLENLLYLGHLNLSFNRLHGEIPKGGSFANFTAQSFMGNDALCGAPRLQVPPCNTNAPRGKSHLLKYILIPIALTIVTVGFFTLLVIYRMRKRQVPVLFETSPRTRHKMISYQELLRSIDNFSEARLLGVGSFGSVYRGTLSDGSIAAIKVLDLQLEGAYKSFDIECKVMSRVRHRNLVKIITTCSNLEFRALVLQYMPNGSLEKWLYSHNYCLDLLQRVDIMVDVAFALEYLHFGYSEPVVHCDLKPSNILLDEDMVAHVGDFGIAKLLIENMSTTRTNTLGTIGYIAPEYGAEGRVSTRGDVYSYGIILMETFTRRKPTDEMFVGESSLKQWVNASFPNAVMEIVDANLLNRDEQGYPTTRRYQRCLSSIMELALECSRESPQERINMKQVVVRLKKIKLEFLANEGGN